MNKQKLEARVVRAIHEVVAAKKYVSSVDVFIAMGLLDPKDYEAWRMKRVPNLERVIQVNLGKISFIMKTIRQSCLKQELKPSVTHYTSWGKGARITLQISKSGNQQIEHAYSTHYIKQDKTV